MSPSFFFYDLETTGVNPRQGRIMQFAGVRTDLQLNPLGEQHNYLIRLTDDVLPDPDAVLITGITPQQTVADGLTEAEFLKIFYDQIAVPGTIFTGFNTVRFDDEFMRYMMYRNFYDPYEWQWQNERSRWDILDVVRMTRALRPDGISWPYDTTGKPTNRLELLSSLNNLDHANAHDALSDVQATIAVAKLLRTRQAKLFDYLLTMRDKKAIQTLMAAGKPVVYTSGKYENQYEKTTVVGTIAEHPNGGALVFDLRHDPAAYTSMTPQQLAEGMRWSRDENKVRFPVKTMKYNRCPAVAPITVLDAQSQQRLSLDISIVNKHFKSLTEQVSSLAPKVLEAIKILDEAQQTNLVGERKVVDERLYDGFFGSEDKTKMSIIRAAAPTELSTLSIQFDDDRLSELLPLYKARNFPKVLSSDERQAWETFREKRLLGGGQESRAVKYFNRLAELAQQSNLSDAKRYLLEELQLYGQSILPESGL